MEYLFSQDKTAILSKSIDGKHDYQKKSLWPLFINGFQLPYGWYSQFEEAAYFFK